MSQTPSKKNICDHYLSEVRLITWVDPKFRCASLPIAQKIYPKTYSIVGLLPDYYGSKTNWTARHVKKSIEHVFSECRIQKKGEFKQFTKTKKGGHHAQSGARRKKNMCHSLFWIIRQRRHRDCINNIWEKLWRRLHRHSFQLPFLGSSVFLCSFPHKLSPFLKPQIRNCFLYCEYYLECPCYREYTKNKQ